jgi:prepilin-type N-terminal cleavage/methylation domain-containing protein
MSDRANNPGKGERRSGRPRAEGFTLLEVVTALAILGLASSSVLLVINRCMAAVANSTLRMEAFALAQENLEKILVADSVTESVEFGASEMYPDITCQTAIEAFSEPATGKMWVRVVCSAQYVDSAGEKQTVQLEHWLTELTDQQAGVESSVIEEWMQKGLLTTDDGSFLKYNLDIFVQSKGDPTAADKRKQVRSVQELATSLQAEQQQQQQNDTGPADGTGPQGGTTGPGSRGSDQMNLDSALKRLRERQR